MEAVHVFDFFRQLSRVPIVISICYVLSMLEGSLHVVNSCWWNGRNAWHRSISRNSCIWLLIFHLIWYPTKAPYKSKNLTQNEREIVTCGGLFWWTSPNGNLPRMTLHIWTVYSFEYLVAKHTPHASSALSGTCSFRFGRLIGGLFGCFSRVGSVVDLGMDCSRLKPCHPKKVHHDVECPSNTSILPSHIGWDLLFLRVHAHMTCPSEL